jgi:hypothetical protein
MKTLLQLGLCLLLATEAYAQRRGGMGGGFSRGGFGGFRGGPGFARGGFQRGGAGIGGFRGGRIGGGFRGGRIGIGGFHGGRAGIGFRGSHFSFGGGFRGFRGGVGFVGWSPWSWGFAGGFASYWPGYYDYWPGPYPAYDYAPSPNVTVIYAPPPPAPEPVYVERVRPVVREYDEYGRERARAPAASPIYLIAFKDQVIHAASSYRVEGDTLHYATLQNEARSVPLDTVDREFSLRLNRERRVPFQLPEP